MRRTGRRAFTLVEISVVSMLVVAIGGILVTSLSGARRTEEVAAHWLNLMESVAVAMHHLRTDVRQMSFVPGQTVAPASLRIDASAQRLRLRRSVMPAAGKAGSQFVFVEYSLVPARSDGEARFHIQRREFTASGTNLPGKSATEEINVYRSFQVRDLSFRYVDTQATDERVLTVGVTVVSDVGRAKQVGAGEAIQSVATSIQVMRPLPAMDPDQAMFFAQPVTAGNYEIPPGDVRAPTARDGAAPAPLSVD